MTEREADRRVPRVATQLLMLLLAAVVASGAVEAKTAKKKRKRAQSTAESATPLPAGSLQQRLLALASRPPVRKSEFAVAVAKVGETAPLVAVNADVPLSLASTTKLFTTAAAVDRLGTDYEFKTRIYRDAEPDELGELPGHLVIEGGGDPAISGRLYDDDPLAVFRPWAEALRARGIRKIRDGLLLDVSFFDGVNVHPDWPRDQAQNWWQAPVSALSYNDNVVLVRATGGLRPGAPAILGFYPAGPHLLRLIGRVMTTAGYGAALGVRRGADSRTVVAMGHVGKSRTRMADVTVPDPPLYLAAAFSKVLRDTGIEVGAPPQVAPLQRSAPAANRTLLHVHATPILPAVAVCNKRSQSFYAEQILKTLGAERHSVGSWDNGLVEVRGFVSSLGLDVSRYELVDGSGRSPKNRASAGAYLDYLQALATRWDKFSAFEPTLAISGNPDGSLRHRLLSDATRGNVHGKTGFISGVVTICGYLTAKSGTRYAFAILINGGITESRGHAWQDRFLTELANRG